MLFRFHQTVNQETLECVHGHKTRAKISWSKGTEIILNRFSFHCEIILEIISKDN